MIILVLTSILSIYMRDDRNSLDNLKSSYPYLEQLGKTVYIDSRSIRALDYISKYETSIDLREYPHNMEEIKDSYIVINHDMIGSLKAEDKNRKFTKEIENPPDRWVIIKQISEGKGKVTIYYSP
ncbi:MAG: hypothetical protein IH964_13695 [Candidatus Dadabacteria bacterium]|nr:hypothetical protein [Candidatus Dadabacteria bacterium]